MMPTGVLAEYDASREAGVDRSVLCHAPFVSLNFDQLGRVTACCYNREFVLGRYPEQSVREIWTGADADALRETFRTGSEARGCDLCFHQLKNRNFSGALMRQFDHYATAADSGSGRGEPGTPMLLEFEISNTCSLECVMCGGHWSSTIRARREKLPPLRTPYDRAFVSQLEEFLPAIRAAKFLGGEPFLIERYYDIWDRIGELNPDARLWITTSAAVIPARARALLEHLRASFVVSLDSLTPAVYESIRQNARFDEVMRNLEFLRLCAERRGTTVAMAVCPMRSNWRELAALVDFANRRAMDVYFNTVTRPVELSLGSLPERELAAVIAQVDADGRVAIGSWSTRNRAQWSSMLSQLRGWLQEKQRFDHRTQEHARALRAHVERLSPRAAAAPGAQEVIDRLAFADQYGRERAIAGEVEVLLLPQVPLAATPPSCAPETLLLLAYAWYRWSAAPGTDPGAPADASVADEESRLRHLASWMRGRADDAGGLEALADHVRDRLAAGDMTSVTEAVRALLEFTAQWSVLLHGLDDNAHERLERELAAFRGSGIGHDTAGRAEAYVRALLTVPIEPLLRRVTGTRLPEADRAPAYRVPTFGHLVSALYAIELFHRVAKTDRDQEVFGARIRLLVDGLEAGGPTDAITNVLPDLDVRDMCAFIVDASDDALVQAMARFA